MRAYVLGEGVAAVAVVIGVAFWAGLAIDWLFEPSPAVRVGMWTAAVVAVLAAAWRWIGRRLFARLRDDSLALLVERKHPQLDESLITAVQTAGAADIGPHHRELLGALNAAPRRRCRKSICGESSTCGRWCSNAWRAWGCSYPSLPWRSLARRRLSST